MEKINQGRNGIKLCMPKGMTVQFYIRERLRNPMKLENFHWVIQKQTLSRYMRNQIQL